MGILFQLNIMLSFSNICFNNEFLETKHEGEFLIFLESNEDGGEMVESTMYVMDTDHYPNTYLSSTT